MDLLKKIGPLLAVLTVVCSIALNTGILMERISRLKDDVAELKQKMEQVMIAIGSIEHSRWKEKQ